MNSHEIEPNVKRLIENFSKENFLYDLLLAYSISKTSITRLKAVISTCLKLMAKNQKLFQRLPLCGNTM